MKNGLKQERIAEYAYHIHEVIRKARDFGATDKDVAKGLAEWMEQHVRAAEDRANR